MDFRISQGNTPRLNDTLADASGNAVNLAGATVKFRFHGGAVSFERDAEVVNSGTGAVSYLMTTEDTAVPGEYRGQWRVTRVVEGVGEVMSYPTDPLSFEIVAAVPWTAPGSVSLLSDFYDPVRAMLGDFKKVRYTDGAIASVLRTVLRMGKVPGYTLSADTRSVTPAIGGGDVRAFALLVYHATKAILLPNVAGYAYRTRAMSERFDEQRHFLFELQNAIYDLEFPEMLASYQSFYAWVNGVAGMDVWAALTEMKVNAPVATVTLNSSGVQVNTQ